MNHLKKKDKSLETELEQIISEQVTDKRVAPTTLETIQLLGMNKTVAETVEITALSESNVCRIQTRYKELITTLQEITDNYIFENGLEDDPAYRMGKKKPLSRLVAEAKALDDTFFNLLVSTVKNPSERTSTRITAYEKLQVMLSRLDKGDTNIGKSVEEVEENEEGVSSESNSVNDPLGLFKL